MSKKPQYNEVPKQVFADFNKIPMGAIAAHRNTRCKCRNNRVPGVFEKWVEVKQPNPDLQVRQRSYQLCACAVQRFQAVYRAELEQERLRQKAAGAGLVLPDAKPLIVPATQMPGGG